MDQPYPLQRTSILHRINVFIKRYDFEIYLLRRNPVTLLGLGIIILMTLVAIFGPSLAPYDPLDVKPADRLKVLQPPIGWGLMNMGEIFFHVRSMQLVPI